MKKELYKDMIKRLKKGAIYLTVLVSITLASVISMVSIRKNMVSSTDKDTQKMFSSNSETIDNILPVNNQTIGDEQDKKQEKISYVTYEEERKETEKITTSNKEDEKQSNGQSMKQKEEAQRSGSQSMAEKGDLQQQENQEIKTKEISNEEAKSRENTKQDIGQSSKKPKEDIPKSAQANDHNSQNQTGAKEVFFQGKKSFITPLGGKIANDYSCDKLIYSKTLDEWRVHQGIDITAKEGTNVKAVLDGYVEEIKSDDEYGVTVVIRHSKSLASVYKNLANEIVVLPNQIIKQGDVIGLVGNTGKIETDLSSHLHFEMLKDNKLIDPKIYIQFE